MYAAYGYQHIWIIKRKKGKDKSPKKKWVKPTIEHIGKIDDFLDTYDKSSISKLMDAISKKIKNKRKG